MYLVITKQHLFPALENFRKLNLSSHIFQLCMVYLGILGKGNCEFRWSSADIWFIFKAICHWLVKLCRGCGYVSYFRRSKIELCDRSLFEYVPQK
jgi:hypothetical protein